MTPEEQVAHDALLAKVKETATNEINTRGFQNADAVQAAINAKLEGLSLEALRTYEADKTKVETTLRNLAAQQEKLQNRAIGGEDKIDPIRAMLDKHKAEIETRFSSHPNERQQFAFNIRAAANMTSSNTIDVTTNSITAAMAESMSMEAYVPKRRGVQFISDIADRVVVPELTKYKSWLEEGSEEGAFAVVAEGGLKPLVSAGVVRNVATAKKVAGKYVVTEEFAKFYSEAYDIIRSIIQDKLQRDYAALLVVDLNAQAASYAGGSLDDAINNANDYDAVAAVAAQIMALNFVPDVLIVHPTDLWRIRLAKDGEDRYLFPVQNSSTGQVDMFGFNVVVSTYQTAGQFTLGESRLFKIREEAVTVRMGYGIDYTVATIGTSGASGVTAVSSDFDTNRFRVIVETYFMDWIATAHIGSFVKASFATVKAALETP